MSIDRIVVKELLPTRKQNLLSSGSANGSFYFTLQLPYCSNIRTKTERYIFSRKELYYAHDAGHCEMAAGT